MAVPISTARVAREVPLGLARGLLCAQGVARSSVEATARALALLLQQSGPGPLPSPVVLSGEEGARHCGFERRTWWIVKRRLLALGHLVASAGGEAPSGSHGGRGRKGTYCVSPETFRHFLEGEEAWIAGLPIEDLEGRLVARGRDRPELRWLEKARSGRETETVMPGKTVMRAPETVMPQKTVMPGQRVMPAPQTAQTGMRQTGMGSRVSGRDENRSEHRRSSLPSLLSDPSKTSDVLRILEGRTAGANERPETVSRSGTPPPGSSRADAHHRFDGDAGPVSHHRLPGDGDPIAWLEARVLESRRALDGPSLDSKSPSSNSKSPADSKPPSFHSKKLDPVPSAREIVTLFQGEPRPRVREALVKLLDRALLLERFDACLDRQERLALLRGLSSRRLRSREPRGPTALASGAEAVAPGPSALTSRPEALGSRPDLAPDAVHDAPAPTRVPTRSPVARELARTEVTPRPMVSDARRRARAPHPLWSPDDEPEKRDVWSHVAAILERANREFKASFDVERSRRDTLLYPYDVVRRSVANVLLKEARGYRFENPGAVLWDGITLPTYRLEEFAVANLEEVQKRCLGVWVPKKSEGSPPFDVTMSGVTSPVTKPEAASSAEAERRRAHALRTLHEALPESVREDLDRRAAEAGRASFLGRGSTWGESVLALRVLRARDELLAREHADDLAARLAALARETHRPGTGTSTSGVAAALDRPK